MPYLPLPRVLATSFLAGEQSVDQLVARGERTLGRQWRWLWPVARRYMEKFAGIPRPRHRDVVRFLRGDATFRRAISKYKPIIEEWLALPTKMQPVPAAEEWGLPSILSTGDLADWFWLDSGELEWFADLKGLAYKAGNPLLDHYRYRVLSKPSGAIRLIEAPKPRLKKLQRQILEWILDKIPPHPAVHGFVKGRSIGTFVAPHTGRRVVLRMDLRDFFPSFAAARIQTFFRTAGYPELVADLLGGICTNAVPPAVWKEAARLHDQALIHEARALYSRPHLPQGAPSSPSLANICSRRMDCRLDGLAKCTGATYTRYADDIAFSGGEDFEKSVGRFQAQVAAIVAEEGFQVNHRKTRVMRQGVRQHLAGLVANRRVNVMRKDFDLLKATLTNCARFGPEAQNRESHPDFRAHLAGRVAFVESINPDKGKRLRSIEDRIVW